MLGRLIIITLLLISTGCQQQNNEITNSLPEEFKLNQKVIYGDDDRINLYEIMDPNWINYANGTVALLEKNKVIEESDHFFIQGTKIGEAYGLCSDEPFFEEPVSAFCSGSLIAKDLIVTAGHCIRSQFDCDDTHFVFNFAYISSSDDNPQIVEKNDVYSCKEIIHSEVVGFQGSDFAIIRLDRDVIGHTPLAVRSTGIIKDNADLVVIGHPSGLPTKFADGASVRSNLEADYFVANLDTYGGNSGSAVFDKESGLVEGILVRGERDYVFQNGCRKSNKCDNDGCRGEDVTRITKIFEHISIDDLGSPPPPVEPNPQPIPDPSPEPDPQPIPDPEDVPEPPVDRSQSRLACERSLGSLSAICSLL